MIVISAALLPASIAPPFGNELRIEIINVLPGFFCFFAGVLRNPDKLTTGPGSFVSSQPDGSPHKMIQCFFGHAPDCEPGVQTLSAAPDNPHKRAVCCKTADERDLRIKRGYTVTCPRASPRFPDDDSTNTVSFGLAIPRCSKFSTSPIAVLILIEPVILNSSNFRNTS